MLGLIKYKDISRMSRRRQGLFDDLMDITARLPWWVGVLLAVVSYYLLHAVAAMDVSIGGGMEQVGDMVTRQMYKTLASLGQYLFPLVFLLGALVSFIKDDKQKRRMVGAGYSPRSKLEPVLRDDVQVKHQVFLDRSDKLPHDSWSIELIKSLEWKRFEELCAGVFLAKGYDAQVTELGADGGIDIHLFKPGTEKPLGIIQCKAWNSRRVGVKPVRELYGVMAAEETPLGIFIASGDFTDDARSFAKGKHIKLLTGRDLLGMIKELPEEKQSSLLTEITKGDYTTPTCPSCGIKMKLRTAKKGGNVGGKFWGCVNYPRCTQRIPIGRDG
jgi:restriction system protein